MTVVVQKGYAFYYQLIWLPLHLKYVQVREVGGFSHSFGYFLWLHTMDRHAENFLPVDT
jgi:hypothetical protein